MMEIDAREIGSRIAVALKEIGKSQSWLARMTSLSNYAISRYISGERTPNLDSAARVATAIGVSLDWLAFGIRR